MTGEVHAADEGPVNEEGLQSALLRAGCTLARQGGDLMVVEDERSTAILKKFGLRTGAAFFSPTGGRRWLTIPNEYDPRLPLRN